ncbi:MAG: ATP-binding protein [Prosthecobacter sp.]|uniref:sensor histidine kinase n=1 Tax=Prosthecobacter sp. TaxID=1965333 RepID=UPI0038FE53AD
MKSLSFRLQIALLSAVLTSTLLAACGYVFWQVNEQIHLNRLDRELRNLGSANLDRVFRKDHWERLENALDFMAGPQSGRYIMLVLERDDTVLHRSVNWPMSLDAPSLPVLAKEATEQPEELDPASRLHRAPPPARPGEPLTRNNPPLPRKQPILTTRSIAGRTWRIGVMGNPYTTLVLGADMVEIEAGMSELRRAFMIGLPIVMLCVAVGGWLLAGRALRPVRVLTQAVEGVHAHDLDQRLDLAGHDSEFRRLVEVFNAMLARLETSFHQSNRFTADAAHELRSPLAILQGELEQALQHSPDDSAEQRRIVPLLDEVQHLKAIVEKLLLLAQADAGKLPLDLQPVNVSDMLHEVIADAEILANGLRIEHDIASDCVVRADSILLHQLLQNLAANALRYNQPGGFVRFTLAQDEKSLRITVANSGPGIPEADRIKIFQRFHRADAARNRAEGVGLGLAIAREIARAHGGELELLSSASDETCFGLTLPL